MDDKYSNYKVKTKLNRRAVETRKGYNDAADILNCCKNDFKNWRANGENIYERKYFHREIDEEWEQKKHFEKALEETRRYRSLWFHKSGEIYRRHCTCVCEACVTSDDLHGCSESENSFIGNWTKVKIKATKIPTVTTTIPTVTMNIELMQE